METTQKQESYVDIVRKAWDDTQFKSDLLNDPIATIEKFTGKTFTLPEGQKIVAVDQTDESIFYFNIPVDPRNVELTEAEMEAIAGGAEPGDASYDLGAWLHKKWNELVN